MRITIGSDEETLLRNAKAFLADRGSGLKFKDLLQQVIERGVDSLAQEYNKGEPFPHVDKPKSERKPLSPDELTELERALSFHGRQLERALSATDWDYDDEYLSVAASLRPMLCDRAFPLLLTYAEANNVPLEVYGPRVAKSDVEASVLFLFNATVASPFPSDDLKKYSLRDYLDAIVSVHTTNGGEKQPVTPREVINAVASRVGPVHWDPRKGPILTAMRGWTVVRRGVKVRDFEAKRILRQLGECVVARLRELPFYTPAASGHSA